MRALVRVGQGATFHFFRSLSCRVDRAGFHAYGRSGAWKLLVRIQPFSGYRRYEIEYGEGHTPAYFIVDPPSGPSFSNANEPPADQRRLTVGGAVHFIGGPTRLGLGFAYAYDGLFPNPGWVQVLGSTTCRYPRPRR